MPDDTFASFAKRLDVFANGLKDPELRRVMGKLGDEAVKKDVPKAAAADLGGDDRFSGWKGPRFEAEVKHQGPGSIVVQPKPRSRGMVRVAQSGRNQGNASGFAGPGLNVRTGRRSRGGIRQTGVRRSARWNGRTQPKHTWDDAEKIIDRETPKRVDEEVTRVKRKAFGY